MCAFTFTGNLDDNKATLALRNASPTATTPSSTKLQLTAYIFPSRSLGKTPHDCVGATACSFAFVENKRGCNDEDDANVYEEDDDDDGEEVYEERVEDWEMDELENCGSLFIRLQIRADLMISSKYNYTSVE